MWNEEHNDSAERETSHTAYRRRQTSGKKNSEK
jgi:hypothetical protein